MDNKKNNDFYIKKIIADLLFVMEHTKNVSKSEFESNPLLIDSVMFRIIQIAENSEKVTNDFKEKHTNIPWRSIKGMRNIIVHDYGVVDFSIVYDTIVKSIPEYHSSLSLLVE